MGKELGTGPAGSNGKLKYAVCGREVDVLYKGRHSPAYVIGYVDYDHPIAISTGVYDRRGVAPGKLDSVRWVLQAEPAQSAAAVPNGPVVIAVSMVNLEDETTSCGNTKPNDDDLYVKLLWTTWKSLRDRHRERYMAMCLSSPRGYARKTRFGQVDSSARTGPHGGTSSTGPSRRSLTKRGMSFKSLIPQPVQQSDGDQDVHTMLAGELNLRPGKVTGCGIRDLDQDNEGLFIGLPCEMIGEKLKNAPAGSGPGLEKYSNCGKQVDVWYNGRHSTAYVVEH
ncbi:MAG: hypothetical protein M1816_003985 [Peltula sp. TS41687]|nr:MAG: hypothetical protein M1816_003985 [Peltula sp. TS41687]